ncbi:MAG: hypothetical protein AUJ12_10290 [Alphaproteobacteria bacterium CG1_02_46_17]|nr:MAG: hypothetical protein AUJ12_10290 [Alphaproteobacteria bacterium CG1_02_46_17]
MSVSVVIPAYNAERFIRQTLDSVLNQSYRDMEIIIVDDGSKDATLSIIQDYATRDDRIKVYSQTNKGGSAARNLGVEKSTGEFVAFLDADDLWHPHKIQKQVDVFLNSSEKVGLVYTFSRMIDTQGYIEGQTGACVAKSGDVFYDLLKYNFIGNGSVAMVRRNLIPKPHAFDPEQIGNDDIYFYLKMAALSEVGVVPEFLVGYRWNTGQNNSANIDRQINSYKMMIQRLLKLYPDIPKSVLKHADAGFYMSYAQTLFKRKQYGHAIRLLGKFVLTHPPYLVSQDFFRFIKLVLRWGHRKIFRTQLRKDLFLGSKTL